jgi:hypothetical protein
MEPTEITASNTYSDDVTINTIAEKVKRGECILFLGAGVHYPPPQNSAYVYPESQQPKLGNGLSKQLAESCQLLLKYQNEDVSNLQRVSLFYEKIMSRNSLVEEVKKIVSDGKQPSPAVRALAELNFPLIITTNYDQLFEKALYKAGKNPRVGIYNHDEFTKTTDHQAASIEQPFVFKIHGDVDKPESMVITDEDYIHFVLRMSDKDTYHPVPETFRYRFKCWPTLFIGYSLMDYNLRLLFKTLRWKIDQANIPETYSVGPSPDPLILDVWQNQRRYVKFIVQDLWTFVPKLYQTIKGVEMPL